MDATMEVKALRWAARAAHKATRRQPRTTLPVLEHVLLTHDDTFSDLPLNLRGTDLELVVDARISATVNDPTPALVSAGPLAALAAKLPARGKVRLSSVDGGLHGTCGAVSATLPAMDPEEYPVGMSALTSWETLCHADAGAMQTLIRQGIHAAAKGPGADARPILGGAHIVVADGAMTIESADNYRIGQGTGPAMPGVQHDGVALARGLRLWADLTSADGAQTARLDHALTPGPVYRVSDDRLTVISRGIAGTFPRTASVWPAVKPTDVLTVPRKPFLDAVLAIAATLPRRPDPVMILDMPAGSARLRSRASDGTTSILLPDAILAERDYTTDRIALNPEYLIGTLRACAGDTVTLHIYGPLSPVVVRDGAERRAVIMPIRLAPTD